MAGPTRGPRIDFDLRPCLQVLEPQVFTKQIAISAALLLALPAVALSQSTVTLNQLTGIRGLKAQGVLGLTQSPTAPMPGDLGRASAMVDLNGARVASEISDNAPDVHLTVRTAALHAVRAVFQMNEPAEAAPILTKAQPGDPASR